MSRKFVIIFCFVLLLLNSCNDLPEKQQEPVTFSILYNDIETAPFHENWRILEEYRSRKNVTLDVLLGTDADYNRDLTQTLESGNIPDIVLKTYPNEIESYASDGLLLPFSDYEDQMPYFTSYIEEHGLQNELEKLRLDNGKYYILPGYQRKIQVQQWIYRKDLFEKHDLPVPTTYDEMFDALVHLKEMYPDSTPITASWGGAHLFAMMGAGYDIPAGWSGTMDYSQQENRWQYAPATENFREMYAFLNRCYEAGILDPEIFTQSTEDHINKLTDGRAFVTVTWITSGFDNWNTTLRENGHPDGTWTPLSVPESTIGIRALPAVDPFRKGLVVPASIVNEPYLENLLSFLDWAVYSEEGMTLTTWGIEDLTYENTENGKVYLPEITSPKNPEGTVDIRAEYGFDLMFNLNENEEFEDYKKPPEIVAFLEQSLLANETLEMQPKLNLDDNSLDAVQLINEKLDPYIGTAGTAFITGELDIETEWNTYLQELDKRGYTTLEKIWNDAWEKQTQEK